MGRIPNIKRPPFHRSQKYAIDFDMIPLWGLFWSVIFCLIKLFSSLAAPSTASKAAVKSSQPPLKSLKLIVAVGMTVSAWKHWKPPEDAIKTPFGHFHFYVNWLGKTAWRLGRVSLTTHMIIYLTIFSSFHNNCTCTITTIFISQRTFANTVNYLAFLVTLGGKTLLLMVKYSSLTSTHFKTLDDGLFIRLCTTLCSTFTTRSEV